MAGVQDLVNPFGVSFDAGRGLATPQCRTFPLSAWSFDSMDFSSLNTGLCGHPKWPQFESQDEAKVDKKSVRKTTNSSFIIVHNCSEGDSS